MMQQPGPPMEVARRLLAFAAGEAHRPEEIVDAAQAAHRRLRERLGQLLGQDGFDALWARALHQARQDVGLLDRTAGDVARAGADGALHALVHEQDAGVTRERLIAVFGACVQLLYTFIGQDLSFRVIQQMWPDVPLGEPQVGEEKPIA
jgi:hypothetical protein